MPVLLILVLYVAVEIAAAVAIAAWIGLGWMFLALFGISLLGTLLLRREGPRAWRAFQLAVREGRPPGREGLDGVLVLIGALLIIVPGFVTDVLGLLCLLPPTRKLVGRGILGYALARGRARVVRVTSTRGPGHRVIEGEIEPPHPSTPPTRP
jgi:UPF0716 protein FxsA